MIKFVAVFLILGGILALAQWISPLLLPWAVAWIVTNLAVKQLALKEKLDFENGVADFVRKNADTPKT